MEQDKSQEHLVNCKTDTKTEKAQKKVPNPKPMNKIFDGVSEPKGKTKKNNNKYK